MLWIKNSQFSLTEKIELKFLKSYSFLGQSESFSVTPLGPFFLTLKTIFFQWFVNVKMAAFSINQVQRKNSFFFLSTKWYIKLTEIDVNYPTCKSYKFLYLSKQQEQKILNKNLYFFCYAKRARQ